MQHYVIKFSRRISIFKFFYIFFALFVNVKIMGIFQGSFKVSLLLTREKHFLVIFRYSNRGKLRRAIRKVLRIMTLKEVFTGELLVSSQMPCWFKHSSDNSLITVQCQQTGTDVYCRPDNYFINLLEEREENVSMKTALVAKTQRKKF